MADSIRIDPKSIVIDLRDFEYRFGDWIAAAPLTAARTLGQGRVCVVATGETATAFRSLLEWSKLCRFIPLFGELAEAMLYLSASAQNSS